MSEPTPNWEREVLEKLALSAIQEQRRSRHWSILFKTLGFLYLFIVLFLVAGWFGSDGVSIKEHTALVDLQSEIASDKASADTVIASLQSAFDDKKTKGVVLRINSPGGSPVQAGPDCAASRVVACQFTMPNAASRLALSGVKSSRSDAWNPRTSSMIPSPARLTRPAAAYRVRR